MKKILIFIALAVAAATVAAQFSPMNPRKKIAQAEAYVAAYYVDTVNEDKLVEDAIKGMLKELDPHSAYSSPEETRELNEPLEGNFTGIGITYNMSTDTLFVLSTVAGGPSEKVGILPGDKIIAVNDTSIAGKKLKTSQIQKMLRGPKGTKVNLSVIRRKGLAYDTVPFTVTRDLIPINSVDVAYMVDPTTGYISLNKFAATTQKEMLDAIKKLKKQGMKDLILDLTDNGGGYLDAAVHLVSEFVEPSSIVTYTKGLNQPVRYYRADPSSSRPLMEDGRLVVMVNQYSASASEITAGALQDHDRAVVVGRRTYGKGLVQRPFPFEDGSMMRLTIAHYYVPSGRDIQKPYKPGETEDYYKDIKSRFDHGELMHADSIQLPDSLRVYTLRNRRPVYGGGGILPDVFVPLDTTANTDWYRNLVAKGCYNQYIINYVDANRTQLKKNYKTADDYIERFVVTDEMIEELAARGESEGVKRDSAQIAQSAPVIKMGIKAQVGRDVFNEETFYRIFNQNDDIFKEAYRLIKSDEYNTLLAPKQEE